MRIPAVPPQTIIRSRTPRWTCWTSRRTPFPCCGRQSTVCCSVDRPWRKQNAAGKNFATDLGRNFAQNFHAFRDPSVVSQRTEANPLSSVNSQNISYVGYRNNNVHNIKHGIPSQKITCLPTELFNWRFSPLALHVNTSPLSERTPSCKCWDLVVIFWCL